MPSFHCYRKATFCPWLCWEFAGVKCCTGRGPVFIQGKMGGPAQRKILLILGQILPCLLGQAAPRHQSRARGLKSSQDPPGESLVVCKSWLSLLLLLAVEDFSSICDEKKIHLPDLTHLSALFPQGGCVKLMGALLLKL